MTFKKNFIANSNLAFDVADDAIYSVIKDLWPYSDDPKALQERMAEINGDLTSARRTLRDVQRRLLLLVVRDGIKEEGI